MSFLNTSIAPCCLRKQNLLHLGYELFLYELSCLSGELEETSIIISSVCKAELLKSPNFPMCAPLLFPNTHAANHNIRGLPCALAGPSACGWLHECFFSTDSVSRLDRWGSVCTSHLYGVRFGLQSLISSFVITAVASGIYLSEGDVVVLREWLKYIYG